jgi:hypothetical protein
MSILAKEDRKDLVWAMRTSLLESVRSGVLTEGKKAAAENFIINEATYEQLLNLAFNPERDTSYKSTQVLEKVALETYNTILEAEETDDTEEVDEEAVKPEEVVEESLFAVLEGKKWDKTKEKAKTAKDWVAGKAGQVWKHMKAGPAKDAYKALQQAKADGKPVAEIKKLKTALMKARGKTALAIGGAAAAVGATALGTAKYLKHRRAKKNA